MNGNTLRQVRATFFRGDTSRRIQAFCVFAVAVGIIGCANNPVSNNSSAVSSANAPFAVAKSASVTRDSSSVSSTLLDAQAQSINAFAVNMYNELSSGSSTNLFFSPYSITSALAMASAGAEGETEAQMRAALSVTLQGDDFHAAMNGLDLSLMSYANQTNTPTLRTVNDAWCQTGWNFEISYLDKISRYYGAGVNLLDFVGNPVGSCDIINDYVSEQTNDKITSLISPGAITDNTRLVLTNAIYFLGKWEYSFDTSASATKDSDFTLLNNSIVKTPLMNLDGLSSIRLRYAHEQGVSALDLPYADGRLAMTVILPDTFSTFESGLTLGTINSLIDSLYSTELSQVIIPSFTYTTSSFSIKNLLIALGMKDAFGSGADFSGIDGKKDLYISDVFHKAYIGVGKSGTEAAAATAVVIKCGYCLAVSSPIETPPSFIADKPFIFVIRDTQTNAILFMGRILDPTKSSN